MRINRLVLNNFSSFEGVNEFDFRVEDNKNIILIGGQNGAGKTSLFSAIKIGLYGSLAFGYVGTNSHYIQKVKEYINSSAFQKEVVEASVIIDISIMVDRDLVDYRIERKWSYIKQHLEETFSVERMGRQLNTDEILYFKNYLQTVIPPGLFDFFLFDGEEVGNVFSTNSYNMYIKNALFTMCDLDVFEIVRKYSSNYLAKADSDEDKEAVEIYRKNEVLIEKLKTDISQEEERKNEVEIEVNDLNIELEELEVSFKNSGGITEAEKKIILDKIDVAERKRAELSAEIKSFVEGLLPFIITADFVKPILQQVDYEEKSERFRYVADNIDKDAISSILKGYQLDGTKVLDEIYDAIVSNFKPDNSLEEKPMIHDLSKEQKNRIHSIASMILNFNKKEMLSKINDKITASNEASRNREILRNAMSEDDTYAFSNKENLLLRQLSELKEEKEHLNEQLGLKKDELLTIQIQQDKCYQEIVDKTQNRNIYKLTNGISKVMKKLLDGKAFAIIKQLEVQTVENLNLIYRKNNLITHIEINDDFKFNLYQNECYSASNLKALVKNYGNEEFQSLIGKKGESILLKYFGVKSVKDLKKAIEQCIDEKQIELFKKVELSRISKGERQIFILSLYWAIIKLSGKKIPFIIDTPYARIDARHRKAISSKFFPNISEQVIILSTDEEINEEYYRTIKPYISKEYLLLNDENANRTTVQNKYFFEVDR